MQQYETFHIIECWTKWLKNNGEELLSEADLKGLYGPCVHCSDTTFRWTASHGIAGASPSFRIDTMLKFFEYLKSEQLEKQLCTKDNEGDIPLQSAINSGAGAEVIRLILTVAPDLTKIMLCSSNKKENTPLQTAFEQGEWCAVEVMLEFCIKNNVLSHLTGVHPQAEYNNTLLHRAFKRGYVKYLKILLKVCRVHNVEILPVLLVLNKKKETPWYHLANRNVNEQQSALSLVKHYGIDVNQLYLDLDTGSTLLHKAYRRNNKKTVNMLKQYKASEDQVDRRGLLPRERARTFISLSASRSGTPEPPTIPCVHVEGTTATPLGPQQGLLTYITSSPPAQNTLPPITQEPHSPITQKPCSSTAQEPRSSTAQEPRSSIAQEPRSSITQEPSSPITQTLLPFHSTRSICLHCTRPTYFCSR